jgi:hypothetical protein
MNPEDLKEIRVDLKEIRKDLSEHMRRTDVSERRLDLAEESLGLLRAEVKPLTTAAAMWGGVGKALTLLVPLAGLVLTAWKLLS